MTKYVVWDWNGTIFNDIDASIKSVNPLLLKHNLPIIRSRKEYREKFSFPIKEFYKKLGFNFKKESFENLSKQYIANYVEFSKRCRINDFVEETLMYFKMNDYKQIIISASEIEILFEQIKQLNIASYFESIYGLTDIYANSKVELAQKWKSNISSDKIFLIGDSIHDLMVANEINARCILYTNGHQNIPKYFNIGCITANSFRKIVLLSQDEL